MIGLVSLGVLAGGSFGLYMLREEMFPYTFKDFDYNLKVCLQHVDLVKKDVEYIKAMKKARESKKARRQQEKNMKFVERIIERLEFESKIELTVFHRDSTMGDLNEVQLDSIMNMLKEVGLSVDYKEVKKISATYSPLGILYVEVKI